MIDAILPYSKKQHSFEDFCKHFLDLMAQYIVNRTHILLPHSRAQRCLSIRETEIDVAWIAAN